jgi:hypothetical protein
MEMLDHFDHGYGVEVGYREWPVVRWADCDKVAVRRAVGIRRVSDLLTGDVDSHELTSSAFPVKRESPKEAPGAASNVKEATSGG